MNIQTFTQEQDWIQASTEKIANNLYEQIQAKGEANLAVSGGTTPFVIYKELAKQSLDFSKINLIQVDERYVTETNPESNWQSISKSFDGVDFRQIIRFEYSDQIQDSLSQSQSQLPPKLGLTILGMGLDGHFASLFAGGEYWDNPNLDKAIITQAPANYQTRYRLSLSPEYIYNSNQIIILIKGQDKYTKLQNQLQNATGVKNWPLEYLYNQPNISVYACLE
ncbi:MAG: putative 6-phosphogluconolactonase protein [Candidatus Parcubacteria bacterium]|jgi:6-phosphogluconolactonase